MGRAKKNQEKKSESVPKPPELARRRENRHSAIRSGRTIGEKREKLETANERMAIRKKQKQQKFLRVSITVVGFGALIAVLALLFTNFLKQDNTPDPTNLTEEDFTPSVQIIDEDSPNSQITSRMKTYIGQVERAFLNLGYHLSKAVIPSNSIREVDFYLEDHQGYIKMIIDRGAGVSVEDADRMIRYLSEQGITDFTYIDVRIDSKAYWK